MKKIKLLSGLLLFFLTGGLVHSQVAGSELKLSLKEAQDYAVDHNKAVISSKMDVEASRIALWETISNGLPQVSVSGSFYR